jgi:hypothetical protein
VTKTQVRLLSYGVLFVLPALVLLCQRQLAVQLPQWLTGYVDFYLNLYVVSALSGYVPLLGYVALAVLSTEVWLGLFRPSTRSDAPQP